MRSFALVFLLVGTTCSNSKAPETKAPAPEPPAAAARTPALAPSAQAAGGPRVEGQGFVVEVQAPPGGQVGGTATAQVVLKPTSGYHVNKEFPTALKITAPAGVDVEKAEQAAADAARLEETGAEFAVRFTPREVGAKKFTATFKFAVCTATTCDPKRETLAWNVDVK